MSGSNGNGNKSEYFYEKVFTQETNVAEPIRKNATYGYGVRHVQVFIIFLSLCVGFLARAHIGATIIAMVEKDKNHTGSPRPIQDLNAIYNCTDYINFNTTSNNEYGDNITLCDSFYKRTSNSTFCVNNTEKSTFWNVYRTYDWEKRTQEMVLGSFFLGYLLMNFPMGLVCQRWGGKLPLQIALGVSALVSILTPWLALWGGWKAVVMSRICLGLFQAGFFPAIHTLIAKWVPLSERGTLASYIYTGSGIGTILAFQLSGFLSATSLGWPLTFLVSGLLCLIMLAVITIFGAATPIQHKKISDEERRYISGKDYGSELQRRRTPWRAIITSKHVLACFAAHIGCGVTTVLQFSQIPSYLHFIQGVDVKNSGLLSSLPYIANFIASIVTGLLSDFLTNKKFLSNKQARIISNCISTFGPAACLAALSFVRNTTLAVLCLVISLSFLSCMHTGWMLNYIDLAPNYSGALMATGNTFLNIFNVLLPVLVSNVVTDVSNIVQWRILLFIVAGFGLAMNGVFVIFMSDQVQPWND